MDCLDSLFDEIQPEHKKEKNTGKFKPKNLKNPPKRPIPKIQNAPVPSDTIRQSQHADSLSENHIDGSLSQHSTIDKFEGTSNPKTKLQPQRNKSSAAPDADGLFSINRTEMRNHETDGTISPGFDFSQSVFEAPTSLPEIDLLDDVSLEPLFSSAEPTIKLEAKKNGNDGTSKKVKISDPGTYSSESPESLINPGPVTSEEIQVNASESGVAKDAENDEQGQSYDSMAEKEKEDVPNLDDVFDFFDNNDPILEMDEANEDLTYGNNTGGEENDGRTEKEIQTDVKKPSKRKNKGNTEADANVDEGLPKKKDKLPHRIRRKRRKVDPALLEVPEDEINPRQISIRNLILLAEAKEKKWNKEAASGTSNGDASSTRRRRAQEEFEFFYFEEHEEENNGKVSALEETFEPTIKKLNYHTYMNRSSSGRWTQSETELFYKGIRQFGTDFAMIQQLFPNRTRPQIKLKFKSEDKKHPTRIRDAITRRLTDNSQFEKVIEILEIEADKHAPEESESSQAAQGKNGEEIHEDQDFETSYNNLANSGKRDSSPNDDLDALFSWDNQEMEEELMF